MLGINTKLFLRGSLLSRYVLSIIFMLIDAINYYQADNCGQL
jgi:hypothetical protein